jgi:DNA-binding transcriptional LysR family regulator
MESRLSHTLLALAESGHGVAIGPSTLPIDRYRLRVARVVHQGKPLREPLAAIWNSHRALPRYARDFCKLLEAYMREVFPNLHAPVRMPADTARRASRRRR